MSEAICGTEAPDFADARPGYGASVLAFAFSIALQIT
jgi:hypothetical protein